MPYTLGQRSLSRLEGVHPDLAKVVKAAIQITAQDFTVVEGVRSREQMWVNWGKGRTAAECLAKGVPANCADPKASKVTWLANPLGSKHAAQADGYGHAVDLAPWVNGAIDWNDRKRFALVADAMAKAARQQNVSITWGGSWTTSPDQPHFELTKETI